MARDARVFVVAVAIGFLAHMASGFAADHVDTIRDQSIFCDGTYALCTKAPCTIVPSADHATDQALCSCEVVDGWSMGPGQCTTRMPVSRDGHTHITSNYSAMFNFHKTMTCEKLDTAWAWCYGAPCVFDENDPKHANCTCSVMKGPMTTLGGDCRQEACNGLWSGETAAAATFAMTRFAEYMKRNNPNVPAAFERDACPVPQK